MIWLALLGLAIYMSPSLCDGNTSGQEGGQGRGVGETYAQKLLDLSLLHALLELARFGLRETVLYVYISVNLSPLISPSLIVQKAYPSIV